MKGKTTRKEIIDVERIHFEKHQIVNSDSNIVGRKTK
jgi:hypothetical protein